MTKYPAGIEKRVLLRRKNSVRPGSFRPVIYAGLSVVQFATAMYIEPGKKKWRFAGLAKLWNPYFSVEASEIPKRLIIDEIVQNQTV